MSRRDEVILKWVRENRPYLVNLLEKTFEDARDRTKSKHIGPDAEGLAPYTLLVTGFTAGRQFQADNPELDLKDPNICYPPDYPPVRL